MIGIEYYLKIQEYKSLGLAQTKTAKALGISYTAVSKYWHMSQDDYEKAAEKEKYHLDHYRQFILEQLKLCPQIRNTNVYFKLVEAFPNLEVKRATFFRYMKKLREQHGFLPAGTRTTSPRAASPSGYEAQSDFGQYRLKNLYGQTVDVYFFAMVLSYSRMKYVYFSPDPFTTQIAIRAHQFAFRYFGGRTQTILYDLDSVYVASENLGNILFVPAFEEYVKHTGYSVVLCRPKDPQSKGKIEEVIGHIKQSFLEGRIYSGIDSLNSAALHWLDREGNGRVHAITRKIPRELFQEEQSALTPVKPYCNEGTPSAIVSFDPSGSVYYKGNTYQVKTGVIDPYQRARINQEGKTLLFYHTSTNELLAKYPLTDQTGQVFKLEKEAVENRVAYLRAKQYFEHNQTGTAFLSAMKKNQSRYLNAHCIRLNQMTKVYPLEQLLEGMKYCITTSECNTHDLLAYLMYRFGEERAKPFLSPREYHYHKGKSKEIRRKLHG